MRVRLSDDVRDFLHQEVTYLRRHSASAALRLVARIKEARTSLSRFPYLGPPSEHSPVPGTRRLVLGDYVLIYEMDGQGVAIVSMWHGRMKGEIPDLDENVDYESDDLGRPS